MANSTSERANSPPSVAITLSRDSSDDYRERLQAGVHPDDVTALAARRRFRPILLTAITTFLGLAPIIFETSMHSLFLVPMAISLGVGTLVSAFVILILIPVVFVMFEQLQQRRDWVLRSKTLFFRDSGSEKI